MSIAPTLKVFGERNSGTNYAMRIMAANADAEVLPGGAPVMVRRVAHRLHAGGRERLLDAWHSRYWQRNAGWKHCYIDDEIVDWIASSGIRVVVVTKHPMAWLVSLRRSPYHLAGGEPRPIRRERLPIEPDSLLDIWRIKTERYLELSRRDGVALVRSEDLLDDAEEALQPAFAELRLQRSTERWTDFRDSVKHDARTQDEIRSYYREERWRAEVSSDDLDHADALPAELLEPLGYSIGQPS